MVDDDKAALYRTEKRISLDIRAFSRELEKKKKKKTTGTIVVSLEVTFGILTEARRALANLRRANQRQVAFPVVTGRHDLQ